MAFLYKHTVHYQLILYIRRKTEPNMNKWILAMLLIASNGIMLAQDVEVKWDKNKKKIIDVNKNGEAIYPSEENWKKLDSYDLHKNIEYIEANGKTIALMSGVNRATKTSTYEVQEVADGKLIGTSKKIATLDYNETRIGFIGVIEGDMDNWGLRKSADKKKFVNVAEYNNVDSHSPERIHLTVFDDNLNVLWSKDFKPNYTDTEFTLEDAVVTNEGTVVILAKYNKPGKIDTKTELPYEYKIVKLTESEEKETTLKLPSGAMPVSVVACHTSDGDVAIGGIYTTTTKYGSRNGTYIAFYDLQGSVKANITPFSDETFNKLGYRKINTDRIIYDIEALNLLKFDDGSFALVSAEINNMMRFSNDMHVVGYTNQGKLRFETAVTNNFETRAPNNDINSYIINGQLWLFYNKENGSNYRFKTTAINNDGNVILDKELDISALGRNVQVYPYRSVRVNQNSIVVASQLGMEQSLYGIVTVK